jgi:transcription elongation factor Elf1
MLASAADGGRGTRDVSMVEPRVACPRCGAHVMVEARAVERVYMICPVCGLRWDEPKKPRGDKERRPPG